MTVTVLYERDEPVGFANVEVIYFIRMYTDYHTQGGDFQYETIERRDPCTLEFEPVRLEDLFLPFSEEDHGAIYNMGMDQYLGQQEMDGTSPDDDSYTYPYEDE